MGDDSFTVSVTATSSRLTTSHYVVLVHVLDDGGRTVGEAVGAIRYVRPNQEQLVNLTVTPDGLVAECVLVKVVCL